MGNNNTNPNKTYLGKQDSVSEHKYGYPVYNLSFTDPDSLWDKFTERIEYCKSNLELPTLLEISDFLESNLDVQFDLFFHENKYPNSYFFKIKNQIYCYALGPKTGYNVSTIFYFDLKEFFKITDSIVE